MAEEVIWVPPRKPVPLLQELYWPNKWKVLVCCMFLNCTQRAQVDQVVETFFATYPCPEKLLRADDQDIAELIRSLGFKNKRTKALKRFSSDFLNKAWYDARELYGIGEYAGRCYDMLFNGVFGDSAPDDHALADYWHWYMEEHRPGR